MVVKRAFLLTPTPVFGGVAPKKIEGEKKVVQRAFLLSPTPVFGGVAPKRWSE